MTRIDQTFVARRADASRSPRVVLAAALVALGACGGGGSSGGGPSFQAYTAPPPPAPVEQRDRLYYGDRGGIADSVRIVADTEAAYQEAWGRATSRQSSPPPAPAVDFSSRMVVVVGAGRMTTEDRIRVERVGIRPETTAEGGTIEVLLVEVRTIRGCGRSTLQAFPLEIVSVPRHDPALVRFEEIAERDPNCGAAGAPGPSPSVAG